MVMRTFFRSTAIAAVMALAASSAAFAQAERPQRMFRGLFGGPAPRPDRQTEADLSVSLFGAYDTDLAASQGSASLTPHNRESGGYSGADLGLTFTHARRHVEFAVSGGTSAQYYPTLHRATSLGDQGAVSVTVHNDRASVGVMESAHYSPLFMLAPFAGPVASSAAEVGSSPIDTAVLRETMFGYTTGVDGTYNLGPRWSLSSNAAWTNGTVRYPFGTVKQQGWMAGAALHRQVTAASGFHIGYTQQVMNPAPGFAEFRVYNADLGMDYHKALGRTRKTTMGFSFGSAMMQDGVRHVYTVLGDASLNREIGRSWVAIANYHRGLGMVAGFDQPLFSDAISGSVNGLITRRIDFSGSVAYTNGEIGIRSLTNRLGSYNGTARARYAISELFAIYGEYIVYWYDLANNLYVTGALPPNVLRQGVHVGLSLSLPLVR